MPSSAARTCTNRILRDYLVAALRCSPHPLTTTQLRRGAPPVAVQGSAHPLPPTQETIYRLLCSLQGQGAVNTADTSAYTRAWIATPSATADREIATLDALFDAPCVDTSHRTSADRLMPATPLTAEVLAALRRIGCPVTTTDLMRLLNDGRATPLISDQVYRAADALRARGSVRSLRTKANKRVRYWEYIAESPACTCRTRDTS